MEKRRLLLVGESEFIIGYVGRLSKEKGIEYLLKAGEILKQQGRHIKIIIIGDGQEREFLECISLQSGLKENVIFAGFLIDVERWLPAIDVFVLPSLTEGTPLALLEAMLCGIPVVASKVGGVPDIVKSGMNGILVQPGSAQEIADAISLLYDDKDVRLKFGKEAQATVKTKYGVKQWIDKIEGEYLKVSAG